MVLVHRKSAGCWHGWLGIYLLLYCEVSGPVLGVATNGNTFMNLSGSDLDFNIFLNIFCMVDELSGPSTK